MRRRLVWVAAAVSLVLLASACGGATGERSADGDSKDGDTVQRAQVPTELSAILGSYHDILDSHYRTSDPMLIVSFLSQRWRLRGGGNAGYDESLDFVTQYLREAGLEEVGRVQVLEGPLTLHPLAWEPVAGSVSLVGPTQEKLHSYSDLPTLLGKYSGSTQPGGVTASLVDVGTGEDAADYAGVDVEGKVVLGRGRLSALFERAVEERGAVGVISDWLPNEDYHVTYPGIVRYETLPFRDNEAMLTRTGWGLKLPRATAARLRGLAGAGPVSLHVFTETRFFEAPLRELVVEIPGSVAPNERIVLVAHLDNNRPGANNNASGVAGHAELAAAIGRAIRAGDLEPPARTLTFLFGAEREGTRLWLEHAEDALGGLLAAINGDMTGENTALTGGVYRLERSPDPAVFPRRPEAYTAPQDVHSGWPVSDLGIADYPGHFLNQLMWASVSERAQRVGWEIAQHPFEGGSDHDVLLPLGTPTTLSWHWVDPFLSTNLDTPDKVRAEEMKNVALSHGMATLLMASPSASQAEALLEELEKAGRARLQQEARLGRSLLSDLREGRVEGVEEGSVVERLPVEEEILEQWLRWYDEALASVLDLPVGGVKAGPTESEEAEAGAGGSLADAVARARTRLRTLAEGLVAAEPTRLTVERPDGMVAIVGGTLLDLADSGRGRQGAAGGGSDRRAATGRGGFTDLPDAVVLFEGDEIVAVGSRDLVQIPDGARRIDARGKWILPGLIDGFATLNNQDYADAYLAMGVTSIVGVSGGRRGHLFLGADPGPRIFPLEGVGSEALPSDEAVIAAVDDLAAQGVRVALLMYGLTPSQLRLAHSRAKEKGMATIGELGRSTYAQAEAIGLDAFVHTTRYSLDAAPRDMAEAVAAEPFSDELASPKWRYYLWLANAELDLPAIERHAAGLGRGPATLMPTLSLLYLDMEEHENPWDWPAAAWISPDDVNAPADPLTGTHSYDQAHAAAYAAVARRVLELERLYHSAGSRHIAGSATDVWGTMPGISLHTELELLTRIGLSPREALAAATTSLHEVFGLEGVGVIEKGGKADLIIVDSDPTLDLRTLREPTLVIAAGRLVRR